MSYISNLILIVFSIALLAKCHGMQEVLFNDNFCAITCRGKIHTLCERSKFIPGKCNLRRSFNREDTDFMNKQLIVGHNGLRNRIASKMLVANMVEMVWNKELEMMAKRYVAKCKPFKNDLCTNMEQPNAELMKYGFLYENNTDSYRYIAQNRYFEDNVHYPSLLVENALRNWYYEKDFMKKPYTIYDTNLLSRVTYLEGENNFTHLAAPEIFYFGCGFNRVFKGFLLVCNYYPYVRLPEHKTLFITGRPGSMCPLERPLNNLRDNYDSLCSGLNRTLVPPSKLYRNFILLIVILCSYIVIHISIILCVYFCK